MRPSFVLALLAFAATPALACENHLKLEGSLGVDTCRVRDTGCV